ncbi:MAG: type II toxin-antitoxin system VapC family toxin [Candidatus Levybacteria bacterium]|nr:type II toxin-antitoxin system VapC family toxin [Candidatus Levybacteria bacterium]
MDTHILIWWVDDNPRLPKKIKKVIVDTSKKSTILVSSISVWEIALLVKKQKITLLRSVDHWIEEIEKLPFIKFLPVDNQIALKSVGLPGAFHGDPADRFIVTTTREHGASLITADKRILNYPHVQTIW